MGIEPTSEAWEACSITQKTLDWRHFCDSSERLNWKIMENGRRAGFTIIATGNNKFGRNQGSRRALALRRNLVGSTIHLFGLVQRP